MSVQTGLLILFIAAAVVAGVMAMALIRHDRELSRLAQELQHRDPSSNARLTLGMRSPGLLALARAANAELDRERDRRLADERAQAAFQEDLASLSHDIRTPLAGAQGYLQLAERASDPDDRQRYLRQATDRLQSMRTLVDGLFDYAKASDPTLELRREPVALAPVLSDALLGFYPDFTERGWEPAIRFADEGARVLGDEEALARVLTNLASNALRYGSGAPTVTQGFRTAASAVEAAGDKREAGKAIGTAGDKRGTGKAGVPNKMRHAGRTDSAEEPISRENTTGNVRTFVTLSFSNPVAEPEKIDAARLFDRFYKAETARSGQGNGLGLAIVARLAAAMGGTVGARVENGNLTIELALPAA